MEQFSLEKWLQDKSRKVVTRDGRDVEIIYTNSPVPHHPIVGIIDKSIYTWTSDGKLIYGKEEQDKNDLFFADEKKNMILDELKSYLKNTPKEQVEKDWKEIQDWYNHNFTNEEHNEEEELTEFEKDLQIIISEASRWTSDDGSISTYCQFGDKEIKKISGQLLDLARKEILKNLPKWKKGTPPSATTLYVIRKGYYMTIEEVDKLFETLPKKEVRNE